MTNWRAIVVNLNRFRNPEHLIILPDSTSRSRLRILDDLHSVLLAAS